MKTKLAKWIKKCIGTSMVLAGALCIGFCLSGQTAYAATAYKDVEPNNSHEEAQLIGRNAQTPAQYVSNQTSVYRYVTGTLSNDDEDWYMVGLYTSNPVYLDLNPGAGTIKVDVFDSSNFTDPLGTYEFQKYGGTDVYEVLIPADGTYYLRVYHDTTSISATYYFTIGNPQYTRGTYVHNFRTTTLPSKGTFEDSIDLSFEPDVPKKSIAYEVTVGGCTSSVSSKRYFYNEHMGWVATKTTFSYNLPITDKAEMQQEWGVRIISTSTSSHSFTPTIRLMYVAPIIP